MYAEQIVETVTKDLGQFRKTALVIYRCRKRGCLLGFAYPNKQLPGDSVIYPGSEWSFFAFRNVVLYADVPVQESWVGKNQWEGGYAEWEKWDYGPQLQKLRMQQDLPDMDVSWGESAEWRMVADVLWDALSGDPGEPQSGWLKCAHAEVMLDLEEVRADIARYHHRHPVMLPKR